MGKDEQAIHDMEGGREYYTTKLAELREAAIAPHICRVDL